MSFEGKCVIVSAPSGAGKTTIVRYLIESGLPLGFSVSATSRPIRGSEKDGEDYIFLSIDQFQDQISRGDFIEWEEVYEKQYYGTLRSEVDRIWKKDLHLIFDVDVHGGLNLKEHFGKKALALFIEPPSIETLETRLRKRGTESEESISKRVAKAEKEIAMSGGFDKIIVNDDLTVACSVAVGMVREFLGRVEVGS